MTARFTSSNKFRGQVTGDFSIVCKLTGSFTAPDGRYLIDIMTTNQILTRAMYWIGVDLDGTLAVEDEWHGIEHIGVPIPRMVERVKALIAEGHDVRIFTARASRLQSDEEREIAIRCVEDWCETHLGKRLSVTNEKDQFLKYVFDDRSIAVECNTGNILSTWTIKPLPNEERECITKHGF